MEEIKFEYEQIEEIRSGRLSRISQGSYSFKFDEKSYLDEDPKLFYDSLPNKFEKRILTCVISEFIEQLKVISNTLLFPTFPWEMVQESFQDKMEKYEGKKNNSIFSEYHSYEMDPLWKMQKDRFYLQSILEATLSELVNEGYYSCLSIALSDKNALKVEQKQLMESNVQLKKTLFELKKKLLPKLTKKTESSEETFATEDELYLDKQIKSKIEERYVDSWERMRCDQNHLQIEMEENALRTELSQLNGRLEQQSRVNQEVESFLLIEISKLEDLLVDWTNKYNTDLESRDVDLLQLNAEKEVVDNNLKTLIVKLQQQGEETVELYAFLSQVEEEKKLKAKRHKAVGKIQRWWLRYQTLKKQLAALKKEQKKGKQKK